MSCYYYFVWKQNRKLLFEWKIRFWQITFAEFVLFEERALNERDSPRRDADENGLFYSASKWLLFIAIWETFPLAGLIKFSRMNMQVNGAFTSWPATRSSCRIRCTTGVGQLNLKVHRLSNLNEDWIIIIRQKSFYRRRGALDCIICQLFYTLPITKIINN